LVARGRARRQVIRCRAWFGVMATPSFIGTGDRDRHVSCGSAGSSATTRMGWHCGSVRVRRRSNQSWPTDADCATCRSPTESTCPAFSAAPRGAVPALCITRHPSVSGPCGGSSTPPSDSKAGTATSNRLAYGGKPEAYAALTPRTAHWSADHTGPGRPLEGRGRIRRADRSAGPLERRSGVDDPGHRRAFNGSRGERRATVRRTVDRLSTGPRMGARHPAGRVESAASSRPMTRQPRLSSGVPVGDNNSTTERSSAACHDAGELFRTEF